MALRDTVSGTAAVPLGCCATIIGLDVGAIYRAPGPVGGVPVVASTSHLRTLALDAALAATRIGGATQAVEHTDGTTSKAVKLEAAAAGVAIGGVVANTYVNGTGKALLTGDVVLAKAP